jgi:hypothetical protein
MQHLVAPGSGIMEKPVKDLSLAGAWTIWHTTSFRIGSHAMNPQNFLDHWRQLPLSKLFHREGDLPSAAKPKVRADILQKFYPDYPLLPIEFLKFFPSEVEAAFLSPAPIVHHFLSSGTTMRDRSRSSFTAHGLELYHEFSLLSFRAMLAPFFGEKSRPRGISFIPDTQEWPTSSLAQMVAWIGEEFPLSYWQAGMQLPTEPVWVFATGFHVVAFADEGGRFPLPKGSIVIETGGTKGKTRSVTRDESFALIEECFGVDRNHIVSEYGMCELASQAYDFVDDPHGKTLSLAERWFRFPVWAQTKIVGADQSIQGEGDGSLIVDDRIRADIALPFRTEDRVELRRDGAFQLKGRVAFSPLKGCSMLAEDLLKKSDSSLAKAESPRDGENKFATISYERAEALHRLTQKMLADPAFQQLIEQSLTHKITSDWCLADLRLSVPSDEKAWLAAGKAASNQADSWLFIAPRTHDFALLHPLFIAALLDLKVSIRPALDQELLKYWQNLLKDIWSFEILDASWRLEASAPVPAKALLVYGSDETIAELRSVTDTPIQGFGSWVTVSMIHAKNWADNSWVKDAFSLNQQGCMSSRLLFVWDEETPELPSRSVTIGPLSHGDHLHLAHSELDMALEGYDIMSRPNLDDLPLGHRVWPGLDGIQSLLSSRPLTLPVIRACRKDLADIVKAIEKDSSLKLLSCDSETKAVIESRSELTICEVGRANVARWSGIHGGRSLFSLKQKLK